MTGDFLIDGVSAFAAYGVFVLRGGYTGILGMPSFKSIESVSWPEDDGVDADLLSPVLDKRSANIAFGFKDIAALPGFFNMMSGSHYHLLTFLDIGRTMTLRMTSNGSLASLINAGSLSLSFTEDTVVVPETSPYALGATRVKQRGFLLDGIDLSRYGCWVLDGVLPGWRKAPAVKENLIVSSKTTPGQTYYGQSDGVHYKSKDFTLSLLLNAQSVEEFNRCYDALFYALTRPAARSLTLMDYASSQPCYYKSARCVRFEVFKSGTVWCELDIAMTMTSVRPEN